jgi:hypothetical protein
MPRNVSIEQIVKVGFAVSHCDGGGKLLKVTIPICQMLLRRNVSTVQFIDNFVVTRIAMGLQE